MSISGKTRLYGLLGDPVSHTLSPLIQNRAFREYNIDAVYAPFHVLPEGLSAAVEGIRALNIAGCNVTIPHKEAMLSLLDEIDPTAQLIGAVNTVINLDGKLVGYNTDGSGFLRSVSDELNFQPEGRDVLLLGAGGACRAAAVSLAAAGISSLSIANRRIGKAEKLINDLIPHFPHVKFSAHNYRDDNYFGTLSSVHLIVNTTSVGLKGEKLSFFPLEHIKAGALIFDMIYSSSETPLVSAARSAGFLCADGRGMLAAQGEDAFYLWTGIRLPRGYMRQILKSG
jgi:shikimate dehydrogenase